MYWLLLLSVVGKFNWLLVSEEERERKCFRDILSIPSSFRPACILLGKNSHWKFFEGETPFSGKSLALSIIDNSWSNEKALISPHPFSYFDFLWSRICNIKPKCNRQLTISFIYLPSPLSNLNSRTSDIYIYPISHRNTTHQ